MKYLAKIISSDASDIAESCTWDADNRLEAYYTALQPLQEMTFHYDSSGLVSKIDCYYWEYGYGYYLLNWKNDKEIDYIDFYLNNNRPPFFDSIFNFESRYTYTYDYLHRCKEIYREGTWNIQFYLEWENNNITKLYEIYYGDTVYYVKHLSYDDKPSIYNAFPSIPVMHFSGLLFNPSLNNPLSNRSYPFDYDYDEDGYPIRWYIIKDEIKTPMFDIEYKIEQL